MQSRVSLNIALLTSLVLLSAGGCVHAQISAPVCTDLLLSWQWSFNSLGQNPCLVTAFLLGTCYGGVFEISPLTIGHSYAGPWKEDIRDAESCWCSTVTYNLASACADCQEGLPISWSQYSENCTRTIEPSTFPSPVPAGTRVPQWALQNTIGNIWSVSPARTVGEYPEILPGELIDTPASSSTSSASSSPTAAPASTSSGGRSNTGVIVGGVVGGVVAIAAIAGLVLFFWRRRPSVQPPSTAPVVANSPLQQPALQTGQVYSHPYGVATPPSDGPVAGVGSNNLSNIFHHRASPSDQLAV